MDDSHYWPSHAPEVLAERLAAIAREGERRTVGSPRDKAGQFTTGLAGDHFRVATLMWGLHSDVRGFLEHLRRFTELELSLVNRRTNGEQLVQGYITATSVRWLYAMIAGRMYDSAMRYALGLARFENEPNFRSDATEFENLWWDATKAVLLKRPEAERALVRLREWLVKERTPYNIPLVDALAALHQDRHDAADDLLSRMAIGHSILYAKEDPESFDALLCIEGVALANLMVRNGWKVTQDSPLIPLALVDRQRGGSSVIGV